MGNELAKTREEIIDLYYKTKALLRKAQCREVNCDIIDALNKVSNDIANIEIEITNILEEVE